MSIDKIIVSIVGACMIGFIYWFFFEKRPSFAEDTEGQGKIDITVEGGYKPGKIKIKENQETTLTFTRTDQNSCLEELYIPDFSIKEYLPLHTPITVKLKPEHKGEYDLHCGMNMFHGKIVVV